MFFKEQIVKLEIFLLAKVTPESRAEDDERDRIHSERGTA